MDSISREKGREVASRIASGWGLSNEQREQLLDQPDAVPQVITIHDSLHRIFENRDQADSWIKKPNDAFNKRSGLDVMLGGDLEHVRKYLKNHLYNA
jgi:uncharacterized protein (DUF2384 family)